MNDVCRILCNIKIKIVMPLWVYIYTESHKKLIPAQINAIRKTTGSIVFIFSLLHVSTALIIILTVNIYNTGGINSYHDLYLFHGAVEIHFITFKKKKIKE